MGIKEAADLQGGLVQGLGGLLGADEGALGTQLYHAPLRARPRPLQNGGGRFFRIGISCYCLSLLL